MVLAGCAAAIAIIAAVAFTGLLGDRGGSGKEQLASASGAGSAHSSHSGRAAAAALPSQSGSGAETPSSAGATSSHVGGAGPNVVGADAPSAAKKSSHKSPPKPLPPAPVPLYPIAKASSASSGSHPAIASTGYVNPLSKAKVMRERIDQGVDYAGSGPILALGDGKITQVGLEGTGWPGPFIEYRLTDGPYAGQYVYYAEGITPVGGLHKGEAISAGQPLVTIMPLTSTGIEIGWGSGKSTETYAMATTGWTPTQDASNFATPSGRSFSALVSSLGGPPGKVEG